MSFAGDEPAEDDLRRHRPQKPPWFTRRHRLEPPPAPARVVEPHRQQRRHQPELHQQRYPIARRPEPVEAIELCQAVQEARPDQQEDHRRGEQSEPRHQALVDRFAPRQPRRKCHPNHRPNPGDSRDPVNHVHHDRPAAARASGRMARGRIRPQVAKRPQKGARAPHPRRIPESRNRHAQHQHRTDPHKQVRPRPRIRNDARERTVRVGLAGQLEVHDRRYRQHGRPNGRAESGDGCTY